MEETIKELLHQYAELNDKLTLCKMDKRAATEMAIPPDVKADLADIEAEFGDKEESIQQGISALGAKIKGAVTQHGASVKNAGINAVYMKGRVSWDAKALDGFALNHPELFAFRNEGNPSVSLRFVK